MISSLKFIDGKFMTCNIWLKILDAHGNQYGSKWHLALCPQIEEIIRDRRIPTIHLCPQATLKFMSKIQENGARLLLLKEDLIPLLLNGVGVSWLKSWKLQFKTIDGKHIAATFIQAFWRGYWVSETFLLSRSNLLLTIVFRLIKKINVRTLFTHLKQTLFNVTVLSVE